MSQLLVVNQFIAPVKAPSTVAIATDNITVKSPLRREVLLIVTSQVTGTLEGEAAEVTRILTGLLNGGSGRLRGRKVRSSLTMLVVRSIRRVQNAGVHSIVIAAEVVLVGLRWQIVQLIYTPIYVKRPRLKILLKLICPRSCGSIATNQESVA